MKTIILIIIIAIIAFFALRSVVRVFKGEGCSCGDGGCSSGGCSCGGHNHSSKEHKCNCENHHN